MRSGPGKKDRRPAYGGGEARLRVSKQRRAGLGGVAQRRRGWAGAPGGRCQRRLHSAAMERPRGAADGLSRWPLGLLLLLQLLLPPAAVGQDRLDAPPPPAPPPLRWAGPVGVSWGLRAAAPGGPVPRAGRWRRAAPAEDQGCGRVPDFVAKLANNTHQVSARGPGAPPPQRWGRPPHPPARGPRRAPRSRCTLRGWREIPAAEGGGARGWRGSGWLRPAGLCVVTAEAIRDFHSPHSLLLLLKLSESSGHPRFPPAPTPNVEHRCYLPGSWRHNYPLSDCRRSWAAQRQRCALFWVGTFGVVRLASRNHPTAVVRSRLVFP